MRILRYREVKEPVQVYTVTKTICPQACILDEHDSLTCKRIVACGHLRVRSRMGALSVSINGEVDEVNYPILNPPYYVSVRALAGSWSLVGQEHECFKATHPSRVCSAQWLLWPRPSP